MLRTGRARRAHSERVKKAPGPDGPSGRFTPGSFRAEDSPSGLGRTLGKRVGGNASRVRISHPPPEMLSGATSSTRPGRKPDVTAAYPARTRPALLPAEAG